MTRDSPCTILKKGYEKLLAEYQQWVFPVPVVQKFGLKPGWNAVIGSNGCSGVAIKL